MPMYGSNSYGSGPYGVPSYSSPSASSPYSSAEQFSGQPSQRSSGGKSSTGAKETERLEPDQQQKQENVANKDAAMKEERLEAPAKRSGQKKSEADKESTTLDRQISKFEDNIETLIEIPETYQELKNIKTHMLDKEDPNYTFIVEGMKDLLSTFKATKKNIRTVVDGLKQQPAIDRTRIHKEMSLMLKKCSEVFNPIVTAIKDIQENQATLSIPPIKRFFYLADETQKDILLENTKEDAHPLIEQQAIAIATNTAPNIFSIVKEWNELNDTFKKDFEELPSTKRRRR